MFLDVFLVLRYLRREALVDQGILLCHPLKINLLLIYLEVSLFASQSSEVDCFLRNLWHLFYLNALLHQPSSSLFLFLLCSLFFLQVVAFEFSSIFPFFLSSFAENLLLGQVFVPLYSPVNRKKSQYKQHSKSVKI